MSLKHREDSITGIRHREALKTKVATSVQLVGGSVVLELPEGGVCDCTMVKFASPCSCDKITGGLVVNGTTFTLVDAMGTCITGVGGYWMEGAVIAVMIDQISNRAYVLNAAGSKLDGKVIMKSGGSVDGAMEGALYAGLQTPGDYLVRNSKLSATEEQPTVNGQICWQYE